MLFYTEKQAFTKQRIKIMARIPQIIFTVLLLAAIKPLTNSTVPNMQTNSNIYLHHLLSTLLTSALARGHREGSLSDGIQVHWRLFY